MASKYIVDYIFSFTESRDIVILLYEHGAKIHKVKMSDPARGLLLGLPGLTIDYDGDGNLLALAPSHPLAQVTKEQFEEGRARRFGTYNPEKMEIPFWKAMVEGCCDAWTARQVFLPSNVKVDDKINDDEEEEEKEVVEDAAHIAKTIEVDATTSDKDASASNDAHDSKNISLHGEEPSLWYSPIWCTARFGQSLSRLPDGTFVQIGGEHEDFYDPDFLIYNDVIIHHADSTVGKPKFDIYGYPEDVFPPTDWHTATYVPAENAVFIVGCLGYSTDEANERKKRGETPVYRLEVGTWKIKKMDTSGNGPGWIWRHDAELEGTAIRIKANGEGRDYLKTQRYITKDGKTDSVEVGNEVVWVLDLGTMIWKAEISG